MNSAPYLNSSDLLLLQEPVRHDPDWFLIFIILECLYNCLIIFVLKTQNREQEFNVKHFCGASLASLLVFSCIYAGWGYFSVYI
jgi:hypothetical protein